MNDNEVVELIVKKYFETSSIYEAYEVIKGQLSDYQKCRLEKGLKIEV